MEGEPKVEGVSAGGLVTVAYLKAQLDGGSDLLSMFMPLVADVIRTKAMNGFRAEEVQNAIAQKHGLAIPVPTLASLLKRLVSKRRLKRDAGRYWKVDDDAPGGASVDAEKVGIEDGQARLGEALREHAQRRGVQFESGLAALDALVAFVNEEHISMLLRAPPRGTIGSHGVLHHAVVAEFVRDVVASDRALATVLGTLLEGLVLYHAVFQPNINPEAKTFKDLTIVLDSVLVHQAIGYEGDAAQALMRETIEVLRAANVQCIVFDKTVEEIRRILSMYETKLATQAGRQSLRATSMARHFLTRKFAPSDIRQMNALLEQDIKATGIRIQRLPNRVAEYTAKEKELATRLATPGGNDEQAPRVVHDVDCVAGVLVMRKGHHSQSIEEARAVFATTSPLVIQNTRRWWVEDERGLGIEPIVHVRALANLAWLKRVRMLQDYKLRELVALCAAAMRPGQATWERFLKHLRSLQDSNRLTSDEATAIVVSSLSDDLLRKAEFEEDDGQDMDASVLDEIVDRVKASYSAQAAEQIASIRQENSSQVERLQAQLDIETAKAANAVREADEVRRKLNLRIERQANFWGGVARRTVVVLLSIAVAAGAIDIVFGHHFPGGLIGRGLLAAVLIFIALEVFGIFKHVTEFGAWIEFKIARAIRNRNQEGEARRNPWDPR